MFTVELKEIKLRNGTEMVIREVLGDWEATTKGNYLSRTRDNRQVMKFSNKEFDNINEVIEYLERL